MKGLLMFKKLLKWFVILVILLVILICTGCYVFIHWFAKDMIESQLENIVHRDVEINQLSLNIFSTSPEIMIKDLIIANQLLTQSITANKSDAIDQNNRFVDIKAIQFKMQLMPLMAGKIELSELLMKDPSIKIVRHENGSFNFSDLLEKPQKKKTVPKTTQTTQTVSEKKPEKKTRPPEKKHTESKDFSADDLPVSICIGKVGMDNGHIHFLDQQYQQAIHLKKLKVLLNDVNINPENLEKENSAQLNISMTIKTEGQLKTGWAKTFDIDLLMEAAIQPFNVQTRLLDPLATINMGSPSGVITGLQIYESIRSKLMNFEIKALDFLKKDLHWEDGLVQLKADQHIVHFTDGRFKLDNMAVSADGKYLISKKAVDLAADILLDPNKQKKIQNDIRSLIKDKINYRARKYVSEDKIYQNIIDSITAKDGQIHLIFAISGPVNKPDVHLVHPKWPVLDGIISQALKSVKHKLSNELKQKADRELNKLKDKYLDEKGKEGLDNLKDNLLKKLPFSF